MLVSNRGIVEAHTSYVKKNYLTTTSWYSKKVKLNYGIFLSGGIYFVAGVLLAVAAVALLAVFLLRHRLRQDLEGQEQKEESDGAATKLWYAAQPTATFSLLFRKTLLRCCFKRDEEAEFKSSVHTLRLLRPSRGCSGRGCRRRTSRTSSRSLCLSRLICQRCHYL